MILKYINFACTSKPEITCAQIHNYIISYSENFSHILENNNLYMPKDIRKQAFVFDGRMNPYALHFLIG